jgi:hypothetical protein
VLGLLQGPTFVFCFFFSAEGVASSPASPYPACHAGLCTMQQQAVKQPSWSGMTSLMNAKLSMEVHAYRHGCTHVC